MAPHTPNAPGAAAEPRRPSNTGVALGLLP